MAANTLNLPPAHNGKASVIAIVLAAFGSVGTLGGIVTIGNYVIDWKLKSISEIVADMRSEWTQTRNLQSARGQELINLRADQRRQEDEIKRLGEMVDRLSKRR